MNGSIETALFTLAGGLLLHILNSIYQYRISEPKLKYFELRANIKFTIVLNKDRLSNPYNSSPSLSESNQIIIDGYKSASHEVRVLAAEIYKLNSYIGKNSLYRKVLTMPSYEKMNSAASCVIGLSNSFFSTSEMWSIDFKDKKTSFALLNEVFKLDI